MALFGTDGIRGRVNAHPITAETALAVGKAAGAVFTRGPHRHHVVIGKDTRLSGYMLEPALTAGFVSLGMNVILVGPMPTPAVAMLTRSLRADLGVMISASHNPYYDNGIKLFGPDGYKLSDAVQGRIEELVENDTAGGLAEPGGLGRARRLDNARGRYIEYAKAAFPKGETLAGLKIVVDCAHGAAYRVAPAVLWELGAEVESIGVEPDGFNINRGCGSTDTAALSRAVVEKGADLGVALDGDADRLAMCDETGAAVDGDSILAAIAGHWLATGRLKGGGVVGTVMSNIGLERHLGGLGLRLERADVGDRHVLALMRRGGYNVGGEQSGHMILADYATTGDGLIAALQVLAATVARGASFGGAARRFEPAPQVLRSVPCRAETLACAGVAAAIAEAEAMLGKTGRLVARMSGTEPKARVMGQGGDADTVAAAVALTVDAIERCEA